MKRLSWLVFSLAAMLAVACGSFDVEPAPTTGKAGQCATCHMGEFRSAPKHANLGSTTCGICHGQTAWKPARLEHGFELTGAHEKAACLGCHRGDPPEYLGTKRDCVACHEREYDRGPRHLAERFKKACQDCHSTAAWKPLLARPKPTPAPAPSAEPDLSSGASPRR